MSLTPPEDEKHSVAGGTWRWSDQTTVYNGDGLAIRVNDLGDTATSSDNTCTTTTYARNVASGAWMTNFPSTVDRRAGDVCGSGTLVERTVMLYDGGTDPATNAPSDGNITETRSYITASAFSAARAAFDNYGRPTSGTDPMGKTTTMVYSPAIGWPSAGTTTTNPLGHSSTVVASHLTDLPIRETDPNGHVQELDYDALGRATKMWGLGELRANNTPTATVSYNIPFDGNLGQPTGPAKTTLRRLLSGDGTSAKYLTTVTYDDGLGRLREQQYESSAGGRVVAATTYNSRGLTATTSQPTHNSANPGSGLLNPVLTTLPQWEASIYDGLERPSAQVSNHLGTELRRTSISYPGLDRVETTPPVGAKTVTIHDLAGRTTKVEEWKDASTHHDTTYSYNRSGNLTSMTDANGNVRTFTYDLLGRRTATTDPDAGASSSASDAAGRLLWTIDGNGTKVSYTYDDLGRKLTEWQGEIGTGTKLTEWFYDTLAKGKLTSATRYAGGQAYVNSVVGYDTSYRPTKTTVTVPEFGGLAAATYGFSVSYNRAGKVISQTMPAAGGLPAETVTYTYTDLGQPATVTSDYGGGTTYVKETNYTNTMRLASRAYGNDGRVTRTQAYDAVTGWLNTATTATGAGTASPVTVQDDRFTYDAGGQVTRVLDAVSGSPGQSECFGYDGLRRLTSAYTTTNVSCGVADNGGIDPYRQTYTYDAVGNMTTLASNGDTSTYAYPAAGAAAVRPNAVSSITRPSGAETFSYNSAGQLSARTANGDQTTYSWNPLGQIDQIVVDGTPTSMIYDAGGERLLRRDAAGTTLYLGPMELTLSAGQVSGRRYYSTSDGSSVAMREAGTLTWLLSGSHGSAQLAIDATTGNVSRERYLPFGQRRGSDDLAFTDRGFLGKTEDTSTGLVLLSARYYDPAIAKFIGSDPELDRRKPQWANPYSYAGNNPISLTDPDGLRPDGCGDGSGRMECPKTGPSLVPTPSPQPKDTSRPTPSPRPGENMAAFGRWCDKIGWENCPRNPHMVTALYDLFVKDFADCVNGSVGSCFWAFAGVVSSGYGKAARAAAAGLKAKKIKKAGALRRNTDTPGARGRRLLMTMDTVYAVAEKWGIDLAGVKIKFNKSLRGMTGITGPTGVITLTPQAFADEITLAKTLAHERYHVDQVRRGEPYPKTEKEAIPWEDEAYAFEKLWWDHHPLNPKNANK
ncbi:RHS repeat domain-containing protein [Streptosporangium sp. NPDC002721]|uniref:RHS repeat domain-containing protein n=1 Tax=Streptosporangium sp. NPDC002721 TaxID=3366188 RepID=UPI0036B424A4